MKNLLLTTITILLITLSTKIIYSQYGAPDPLSVGGGMLNTVVGTNAGNINSIGNSNSVFGSESGSAITNGNFNTCLGRASGVSIEGGSFNTVIGEGSGARLVSGQSNTILGWSSGAFITGSRNICIGNLAGPSTFQSLSDRLFIDVEDGIEPLIYGEFDNNFIRINGTFEVTAGLSNPSDVNLKNNFFEINETEILEKLSKLDIKKWTYKNRQKENHIGPTAQDFYEIFGLGNNNKSISTIDADGISLAAIKALKTENDELKQKLKEHELLISKIMQKIEKLNK